MKRPAPKPKGKKEALKSSARSRAGQRAGGSVKPKRESAGKVSGNSSKAVSSRSARAKKDKTPAPPLIRRKPTADEIAYQNALTQFEGAVKLLNENHFAKARPTFEKLAQTASPDLAQRSKMYLNVCNQRLAPPAVQLKSAEDHYNYGVQLANQGMLEEAEEALKKALKLAPQLDYVHYALASTSALRENAEQAMEHLGHAIELNARNRYLAQNDPDFSSLSEDPRFTELLYPEKPI
jgi:tetratricopeptide (TPR) repeat protein